MIEIITPHKNISRPVTEADIARVIEDAQKMQAHVVEKCVALAHCQVESKDPLRFFVTKNREIVINPIITRHSGYTVDSVEGCMTYPDNAPITKQRWRKVEVEYQTIQDGKLTAVESSEYKGLQAAIFQHEINHFDAIYCYDTESKDTQGTNIQI